MEKKGTYEEAFYRILAKFKQKTSFSPWKTDECVIFQQLFNIDHSIISMCLKITRIIRIFSFAPFLLKQKNRRTNPFMKHRNIYK